MASIKNDVRIVLVRPRNPLNIGAAARAMLNFGFEDLVLVSPHEPLLEESKAAPGTGNFLSRTRVVPDLMAAIEDRTLVIGTSSLSRRRLSQTAFSLDQLSARWESRRQPERVALVFGSEKTGLSKKDLGCCHWVARIPTTLDCPSMNLGQAVAVCCYEMRRLAGITDPSLKDKWKDILAGDGKNSDVITDSPAGAGEMERLVDEIMKLSKGTDDPGAGPERIRKRQLRRMLLRWAVTSQDVTLALGILRDLSWQLQRKP